MRVQVFQKKQIKQSTPQPGLKPPRPFAQPNPPAQQSSAPTLDGVERAARHGHNFARVAVRDAESVPKRERQNVTGLPERLKAGIERLSGLSLDDVRVRYNSPAPARYRASAYTRGTEIHLGAGQEKHLAHEAWHVVQQKQGRVSPDAGSRINTEASLEAEAERHGLRATQLHLSPPLRAASGSTTPKARPSNSRAASGPAIQLSRPGEKDMERAFKRNKNDDDEQQRERDAQAQRRNTPTMPGPTPRPMLQASPSTTSGGTISSSAPRLLPFPSQSLSTPVSSGSTSQIGVGGGLASRPTFSPQPFKLSFNKTQVKTPLQKPTAFQEDASDTPKPTIDTTKKTGKKPSVLQEIMEEEQRHALSPVRDEDERYWHGTSAATPPTGDFHIDINQGRPNLDFNPPGERGFYATRDQQMAQTWAQRRGTDKNQTPILHSFHVPKSEKQRLNTKTYNLDHRRSPTRQDPEEVARWQRDIRVNRGYSKEVGGTSPNRDLVEGPIVGNPKNVHENNSPPRWMNNADQTTVISNRASGVFDQGYSSSRYLDSNTGTWRRVPRATTPVSTSTSTSRALNSSSSQSPSSYTPFPRQGLSLNNSNNNNNAPVRSTGVYSRDDRTDRRESISNTPPYAAASGSNAFSSLDEKSARQRDRERERPQDRERDRDRGRERDRSGDRERERDRGRERERYERGGGRGYNSSSYADRGRPRRSRSSNDSDDERPSRKRSRSRSSDRRYRKSGSRSPRRKG
jgi:hypothetical protein